MICLLMVSISSCSPVLAATQTTSISQVVSPSAAVAGSQKPLPVSVIVFYNNTTPGYYLVVGILDTSLSPEEPVPGIVVSSTDPCVNQPQADALCQIIVSESSGVERINFQIGGIFGSRQKPGVWNLNATSVLTDHQDTLVAGSVSSRLFRIDLTPVKLEVIVPSNVTVSVDGAQQPAGPVSVSVGLGQHNVAVPQLVNVSQSTRMRFDHWSDGNPSTFRVFLVTNSTTLQADYVTQNLLTLIGVQGNATISSWYDADSNATFSTDQYEPVSGGLGALGLRLAFQGWFENAQLVTNSPAGTISMDKPHTLTAQYQVDYSTPAAIVLGILAVAIIAFLLIRRRNRTPSTRRRRSSTRVRRRARGKAKAE